MYNELRLTKAQFRQEMNEGSEEKACHIRVD